MLQNSFYDLKVGFHATLKSSTHTHTKIIFGVLAVKQHKDPIIPLYLVMLISTPCSSFSFSTFEVVGFEILFEP